MKIIFSIEDNVLGEKLNPTNTTLPLLSEFVDQVSTFLKGDKRIDLTKVKASVVEGSLSVIAYNEAGTLNKAISDYQLIAEHRSLENIDPLRARIVEQWQQAAKNSPSRIYKLLSSDSEHKLSVVMIDGSTEYKVKSDTWVNVDLYLYGKIYDLGGKYKSNVHLGLDNGTSIKIEAHSSLLSQDKENRLYKDQLVRIKAKRNIYTHELKDEKLVSFESYNPHYDEDEFNQIVEKSTKAWQSISNPTQWVEEIRGNNV